MLKLHSYKKGKKCLLPFFHSTVVIKDTGLTQYRVCCACTYREIIQDSGGYLPIDMTFLNQGDGNHA